MNSIQYEIQLSEMQGWNLWVCNLNKHLILEVSVQIDRRSQICKHWQVNKGVALLLKHNFVSDIMPQKL